VSQLQALLYQILKKSKQALGDFIAYTSRPLYRQVEWGVYSSSDNAVIDSTPGDVGPCNSTLPVYSGTIISAYLDMLIGCAINTANAVNALGAGDTYIQIKKTTGGTYTNAHRMWAGMFTTSAVWKDIPLPVGRLYGAIDIASTLQSAGSGGSITWKWTNAVCLNDDIEFKGTFRPILRVIFR
jgi:hypothetical protein